MYGYDHFGMGWGGFGMILVWIIPLLLLVLLFRAPSRSRLPRSENRALNDHDTH